MEYVMMLFRQYPVLISGLVQAIVYTGSLFLFIRGIWLVVLAVKHLRNVKLNQLNKQAKTASSSDDPLIVMTAKTLYTAYQEHKATPYPRSFLADATRQLVDNMFEANYVDKISMISHLLPPMGFIGTIFGMIMIFLAKADPNSELNTTGLGAALFTTLAALAAFVILETCKMKLCNLSKIRIETGLRINLDATGEHEGK